MEDSYRYLDDIHCIGGQSDLWDNLNGGCVGKSELQEVDAELLYTVGWRLGAD